LHTLSAYATAARLTLAQLSVPEKTNEITAIPELLDELAEAGQLEGALVTIDAMGCQVEIADKIVAHKADYVLALKGNQPTLEADTKDYFDTAPATELEVKTTVEKGHGRIETRTYTASGNVDWIDSDRSYPGQPGFTTIKTLLKVHSRVEYHDRLHLRHPLLPFVRPPQYRTHGRRYPRTLGSGEYALVARCRVRRRPVALPNWTRRQKHGHRPPLRPRSRARQ